MATAVTQKTITTRTLPIDPDPQSRSTPDFWDYIEKLKPEEWDRHIVYLYRTDPRASNYGDGQANIDKFVGYIDMPDGSRVPFDSREEVDRAIQQKHGGKAFRLILKRGNERITEGKSCNDAPPKYMYQGHSPNGNGNGAGVSVIPMNETSATADVAKAAMSTMAGQDKVAIEVATNALRGAAEMVQRMATGGSPSPTDDVLKQA